MSAERDKPCSLKKTARIAGLLYVFLIITGIYGIFYVSPKIIVGDDPITTAKNILFNRFLFQTGIINSIIGNTIWVFLVLTLYRLFKQVSERQAKLMVVLVLVQIPVVFIAGAFNITSLMIFKGEILKTFELNQRRDLAMLFFKINDYTSLLLETFWGLWLLPFGLLVYQSGFIPRILGVFLLLNGIAYIIHSLLSLLFPDYSALISQFAMPFWILGEISITLWFLIKGVKSNY